MAISKKTLDEHGQLIEKINSWFNYWQTNNISFNENKKFIMVSTLTNADKSSLQAAGLNTREFNVLGAYISRLIGEFSMQSPQSVVKSLDENAVTSKTVDIVHSIIRNITSNSLSNSNDIEVYRDILCGGFSATRLGTKYVSEYSFDQDIYEIKCDDPTLVGFDPDAKEVHKGDGEFAFEMIPIKLDAFKEKYPNINIDGGNKKGRSSNSFRWFFNKNNEDYIMVCDFFLKEKKESKIYLMGNNSIITDKGEIQIQEDQILTKQEYDDLIASIPEGSPSLPPIPKDERKTSKTCIYRYRLIGNQIIEHKLKTDLNYLPYIFIDGDSVMVEGQQITRPYFYNAKDAQTTKNIVANIFIGQLQELRNTTMVMQEEALPSDTSLHLAYKNPQKNYGTYFYKGTMKTEAGELIQLPAPTPLPPSQIPVEIYNTFIGMDSSIQNLLGSYDAQQGNLNGTMSGVAILAGATQSNAAAKPFMINYIASRNQAYKIMVDMIPNYYKTNRTIPVLYPDGSRGYETINDKNNPDSILDYSPNVLDVSVTEGVSFEAQKDKAVRALTMLSQANPGLNQLLSGKGLPVLLSNLDIKDSDKLVVMAEEQIKQVEQAQANNQGQPNPAMVALELQKKQQMLDEQKMMMDAKEKEQRLEFDRFKLQQSAEKQALNASIELNKLIQDRRELEHKMEMELSENERQNVEQRMRKIDQAFAHYSGILEHHKSMLNNNQ